MAAEAMPTSKPAPTPRPQAAKPAMTADGSYFKKGAAGKIGASMKDRMSESAVKSASRTSLRVLHAALRDCCGVTLPPA